MLNVRTLGLALGFRACHTLYETGMTGFGFGIISCMVGFAEASTGPRVHHLHEPSHNAAIPCDRIKTQATLLEDGESNVI